MTFYSTPEHANAYVLGMTLDAYSRMVEAEEIAAETETHDDLTELDFLASDLADEEDDWFVENFVLREGA